MKTPEKVYLQICGDCNDNDCENCKFEDLEDNVTWCKDKIFNKDIEYIRTDVFIEKACEWLKNNVSNYAFVDTDRIGNVADVDLSILQDFKKYMKDE